MTGNITKETTAQYQKEQAVLLAKSYTELAIMAVTANDRSVDCIEDIDGVNILGSSSSSGEGYRVRTRIAYIGSEDFSNCSGSRVLNTVNVVTPESSLNIIVDVYVEYKELDNSTSEYITYHRRTLQKI
ncbi:MAG TPA: type II secretion system protein [Epsilonproteobacteria bacterium]|nr:type II secretion system protein [Campylobacterota bacterium]